MHKKIELIGKEFTRCRKFWGLSFALKKVIIPIVLNKPQLKHKVILSYLKEKFADVIDKYKHYTLPIIGIQDNCPIWVCWLQGEEQMPPLVKGCYESVKAHSGGHPLKLITMDNFTQYVSIPDFVIEKLRGGGISYTHFSDILRNNLLAYHGGIWLDATIFLTDKLKGWNLPFYTIKQNRPDDHHYVSGYKWTGFCMGGVKGNPLNSFVKDFFNEYHKHEECLIDYFLIDYVIALGYNEIPAIKMLIDAVPYSSPNLYYMQENMAKTVNEKQLKEVCKATSIFKLSYKITIPENQYSLYFYLGF